VNHLRPKNLNLFTIRFPLPAIVSILHRISGFILFLCIPLVLWLLQLSLTADGFEILQDFFNSLITKLILWAVLAAFCFHLVAGIRHLLSDIHIGNSLKGGKRTALLAIIFAFILIIMVGIWLW